MQLLFALDFGAWHTEKSLARYISECAERLWNLKFA